MSVGFVMETLLNVLPAGPIRVAIVSVAIFLLGFRVERRAKTDALLIYFPPVIYLLCVYVFYLLNAIIGWLVALQPGRWDFWSRESEGAPRPSPADLQQAKESILSQADVPFRGEVLAALYDSLPKAKTTKHLVGKMFRGRILRCSVTVLDLAEWILVRPLQKLGLRWGKRYIDEQTGDPLLVSYMDKVFFPLPIWGNVGVIDMMYRGDLAATMNYDHQPWKDFFAVLRETEEEIVLLGCWTCHHRTGGWFTLTLLK